MEPNIPPTFGNLFYHVFGSTLAIWFWMLINAGIVILIGFIVYKKLGVRENKKKRFRVIVTVCAVVFGFFGITWIGSIPISSELNMYVWSHTYEIRRFWCELSQAPC